VARRIRFYLREGQQVKQGEELGFIKFGSRMDLFLPLNTEIAVEMGQPVKAGIDVIARLK
jgi:phosphatidylserine decarboxylase